MEREFNMHRKYINCIAQTLIIFAFIFWIPLSGFSAGPKNVIFYIGDGMSSVQRRITEKVHEKMLAMNTLPVVGIYTTDSLSSIITDSAAAGTAMATGYKTDNSVISMDAWGEIAYETIAEAAKRLGKSVGIVTTTRLTHATPACFGSHVDTRYRENKIAEQYLDKDFEVWMGGGWRGWRFGLGRGGDGRGLCGFMRGKHSIDNIYVCSSTDNNNIVNPEYMLCIPTLYKYIYTIIGFSIINSSL